MNKHNQYSKGEVSEIIDFEMRRINRAINKHRDTSEDLKHAEERESRWSTEGFLSTVRETRAVAGGNLATLLVLFLAFILNSLLIQEVLPDFQALYEKVYSEEGHGRRMATLLLTFFIMAVLIAVKQWSDTSREKQLIAEKPHPAIASPLHKRIRIKHAVRLGMIASMCIGYWVLYNYIASGPGTEQLGTALDLIGQAETRLGESQDVNVDAWEIDDTDSISVARSFLFYYLVELLLHVCLLYFLPRLRFIDIRLAFSVRALDRKKAKTARLLDRQTATLVVRLLTIKPIDDELNCLRADMRNGLTELEIASLFPQSAHKPAAVVGEESGSSEHSPRKPHLASA